MTREKFNASHGSSNIYHGTRHEVDANSEAGAVRSRKAYTSKSGMRPQRINQANKGKVALESHYIYSSH